MLLGGGGNCQGCGCKVAQCANFSSGTYTAYLEYWYAGGFTTPPGGLTLSSATIYVDSASFVGLLSRLRLSIYSSASDLPDTRLFNLTAPAAVTDTMVWTAPDEPLTGNTLYYLALRATATGTGLPWKWEGYANDLGTDNTPCLIYRFAYTVSAGLEWLEEDRYKTLLFDIN